MKVYDGIGCGKCSNEHYQQGYRDAIEELLKYLKSDKYDYWDIIRIAEQLKEQKK